MTLIPPKQEKTFTLTPAGTHVARLVQLIQLGVQEVEWNGEIKRQSKIRLSFELPEETKVFKEGEEAKPFLVSREYTLSLGEKSNLRPIVEGMVGALREDEAARFDLESLVGKACLLSIVHTTSKDGKTYANIATTAPLMKGMKAKEAVNPLLIFNLSDFSQEKFDSLPAFIQDKIKLSPEYDAIVNGSPQKPKPSDYASAEEIAKDDNYPTEDINVSDIPF